jgi:hypothetical protein
MLPVRAALSVRVALFFFMVCVAWTSGARAQSPSGTAIPPASQIIDSAGNVWTLVGGDPLENGRPTAASGISELLYYNGGIYGYASSGSWNQWYVYTTSGWDGVSGDPESAATTIPPASQITDSGGNVWTLVGGAPLRNGLHTKASGFSELAYSGGNIYGYASSGNWSQWYVYTATGWDGVAGDPIGSSGSTPPATSHLGQTIPASLFGIQTQGVSDWPTVSFGVLGKGNGVAWPYLETSRGVYNWSTLDGYVTTAAAHGVQAMYSFAGVPGWAVAGASTAECATTYTGALSCQPPPTNISDWTNFITALVTRYCPNGVPTIQYYELWSEPYDVYGSQNVQLLPAQLATLTHAAYGIIRANCPAAKILTPSMATVAGTQYYNNYSQAYFSALGPPGTDPADIASVHIYTDNQGADTPESLLPGGTLNNPTTTSIINTYVAGKPIWNTEGSWLYDTVGLFASDALHAAFIARWYILHWAAGYSQANWYAWDDSIIGTLCGGSTYPCTPVTIPVTAYQQTYNWLVGRVMYNGCSVAGDGVTWTCALSGTGGYSGLLVWDTAGYESYTPPNASQYKDYRTLSGSVTSYSGGNVTVGVAPILLEN